jgi:hypothetical protein
MHNIIFETDSELKNYTTFLQMIVNSKLAIVNTKHQTISVWNGDASINEYNFSGVELDYYSSSQRMHTSEEVERFVESHYKTLDNDE